MRQGGRWTRSSWETHFDSHERKSLFSDQFISSSPSAINLLVYISPPEEERLKVKARIGQDGGSISCRFYPTPNPGTYLSFSANPTSKTSAVSLQASAFDPGTGLGGWLDAPLDKRLSGAVATGGFRYTSQSLTFGAVATLKDGAMRDSWLIGRFKDILLGVRVKDPLSVTSGLRERSSFALSFSPSSRGNKKSFVAGLEIINGSMLNFAISQHLALIRKVLNPLEDKSVVGITSYLSYGFKISLPLDQDQSDSTTGLSKGIEAAVSYQMNKNWILKAKCGDKGVDTTIGLRLWTFPSLLILAGGSYNPSAQSPVRWGLTLQVENHGDLIYQRGRGGGERGKAVLQRHEASSTDVRNALGVNPKGVVRLEAANQEYSDGSTDAYGLGTTRFL